MWGPVSLSVYEAYAGEFAWFLVVLGGSFVFDVAYGSPQECDGGFFVGEWRWFLVIVCSW